jgi:hypothetical protein
VAVVTQTAAQGLRAIYERVPDLIVGRRAELVLFSEQVVALLAESGPRFFCSLLLTATETVRQQPEAEGTVDCRDEQRALERCNDVTI